MASAVEQLASNLNFSVFAKAEDLKKRIWFTLGALLVYRLGTYIPLPGINPDAFAQAFQQQSGGVLGMFNMFSGGAVQRMAIFALGIMPYISASIIMQLMTSVIPSLEAEEGRRAGPQGHQPVHPLRHRPAGAGPGLRHLGGLGGRQRHRRRSGLVLPYLGGDHAGRRHDVPDVARRADHRARHRQRHFADHLLRHRRRPAACHHRHARTRPHRRAVDRPDPGDHRAGGRGHRHHRLLRARAAPAAHPVSEAAGRQPHVPGRHLAPAAEAQHVGRHPADLRVVAAFAARYTRRLLQHHRRCPAGRARCWRRSATASRSTWRSTRA